MSKLDERYLKIALRLGYVVLIVSAFPAAFFLHFGIATPLFQPRPIERPPLAID